jgi:hypothetical protein
MPFHDIANTSDVDSFSTHHDGTKGQPQRKEKKTGKAIMRILVINHCLWLNQDQIKRFTMEHIHGLIRIYNVCCVKVESAWALFYDIFFLDLFTTLHFSQFQLTWPHRWSRSSPLGLWWEAIR